MLHIVFRRNVGVIRYQAVDVIRLSFPHSTSHREETNALHRQPRVGILCSTTRKFCRAQIITVASYILVVYRLVLLLSSDYFLSLALTIVFPMANLPPSPKIQENDQNPTRTISTTTHIREALMAVPCRPISGRRWTVFRRPRPRRFGIPRARRIVVRYQP